MGILIILKELVKKIFLIILCLYSLFFVVGSVLAPILAHLHEYELSAKLTTLYMFSCHQQPDRSFWLFGYPVAICCRCLGVYLGTALSCIFAALDKFKVGLKAFIVMFLLAAGDVFINYGLGKRLNTGNITRFIAGILVGIIIVSVLEYLFNMKGKKKDEN